MTNDMKKQNAFSPRFIVIDEKFACMFFVSSFVQQNHELMFNYSLTSCECPICLDIFLLLS